MNEIEEKIWDLVDGNLNLAQQQEVQALIASNAIYQKKYHDILAFTQGLQAMDLDEPSMAFTPNVMSKVQLISKPLSEKAKVDKRIIQWIGGFFVVSLALILVFTLAKINWSETSGYQNPIPINLPDWNISFSTKSTFMKAFLMLDVLLALLFIDKFLRFKNLKEMI